MKEHLNIISEKIKLWLEYAISSSLLQTVLPYIFAVILAAKNYNIHYILSALGLVGIIFTHLGLDILDDYYEWKKTVDDNSQDVFDEETQLLIPNTKSINSYLPFIAYFDKTNPL